MRIEERLEAANERAAELESELYDLKSTVRVASDDLRQLAATLHTEDHDSIYDNLIAIARQLEDAAGIYRKEALDGA